MRKSTLLKMASTFAAVLLFLGAQAQISNSATYEDVASATPASISYMTEGTTMPFYAMPDPIYHPGYDPAADDITADLFTWTWGPAAGQTWVWGTQLTLTQTANSNYVQIAAAAVTGETDYILNVKEKASAAFGGCEDATGVDFTIRVVDAPAINAFPYFTTTLGIAVTDGSVPYSTCGDMTAADVTVNFNGYPIYEIYWNLAVTEIDADGNPVATNIHNNASLVDHTKASGLGQQFGANSLTRGAPSANFVMENRAFTSILDNANLKKVRTQYTYTIGGVTDNISRKSDFLANPTKTATAWTPYGASYTYVIIINPTPVTGPIYHIPNDFGNL